ncbi:MAG: ATP-binding protein [Candidatus Kapabacteria bacterium]|nr:ATP-binding protein [Candidatus Kapabacteria bacterium]
MIEIPKNIRKRQEYLQKIEPYIGKNIIKVLTGQRRVGKSYLLFQIIEHIQQIDTNSNIIYINKEDLSFDKIQNETDLNDYILSNLHAQKTNYIFIDEIQEIKNFEKALRSLLLNKNIDIYCTGSNATLLSGELASLLSGRFIEINVFSLSYIEFLEFHSINDSDIALSDYIIYGGLPFLINLSLDNDVIFEYLKNIYSTIIYRDVVARYNLRSTTLLEKLVQFLADNIGSIFSAKKISEFLKSEKITLSPTQILSYIEYLKNAFLIHKVERYDIIGKKIFETGEKYYFENLGIRNAIIGYKPNDRGKILENLIYNSMIVKGYKVKIGQIQNFEIDFVCEKNREIIYIQSALQLKEEKTIEREFGNLLKIQDNYPKKVVTMDNFSGNTYQGIEVVNIRKFLLS